MLMLISILAAVLSLQDSTPVDQHCLDNLGRDRCSQAEQERYRAALGLAPIEQEAAAGVQAYRAMVVDPNGGGFSTSLERRADQAPTVVVRWMDGRRLTGTISQTGWDELVRQFATVSPGDTRASPTPWDYKRGDVLELDCTGSFPVMSVEIADAATQSGLAPVRSAVGHFCSPSSVQAHAFDILEVAVESLPACARLDEEIGHAIALLGNCSILEGDTLTAADLLNAKAISFSVERDGDLDPDGVREWLDTDGTAQIDWAGEVFDEAASRSARSRRVADWFYDRSRTLTNLELSIQGVGAVDDRHGWTAGVMYFDKPATRGNGGRVAASYRQEWTRDAVGGEYGDWRLVRWTVEPFRPYGLRQ